MNVSRDRTYAHSSHRSRRSARIGFASFPLANAA
jgi:hypothetical protein